MKNPDEKKRFASKLKEFASGLRDKISQDDKWTIRGFIDVSKTVYPLSQDTKVISKILELHLLPHFLEFADNIGYEIELAAQQNWYPDFTFVKLPNRSIKFAVDLKTTYRDAEKEGYCNGFTIGSHGKYFTDRRSSKNIQYPYDEYSGHFCLGMIYDRLPIASEEHQRVYSSDFVENIPATIGNLVFFAEEKWRIARDKHGSGNTANIGSIHRISDILSGNGVFAKAGEDYFDDYWINFGKIELLSDNGERKKLSSFKEYLKYRGLPLDLYNDVK